MDKYEIIRKIEDFAPLDTQEVWDASGWIIETGKKEIKKVLLCLTVTQDIINQSQGFDMIISHHPLFFVPTDWKNIDIYCAHTNFDKAQGGTTDTLIETVFKDKIDYVKLPNDEGDFVRYIKTDITFFQLIELLRCISPNLRYTGCKDRINKIALCAGSASEFAHDVFENGADVFITGDLKFHSAIESPVAIIDIGHFESEIGALKTFERIIKGDIEIRFAKEKSPFCY